MNEAATTLPRTYKEIKPTAAEKARFWAKVTRNGSTQPHMESPCWIWTAYKSKDGYGKFGVGGKMINAHRVAWTIANGPIPHDGSAHGICVCHRCDNPACIRVDHLFLGTNLDNIRDRDSKGRHTPLRGDMNGARLHPESMTRGEAHHKAKLTDAKVIYIRARHAQGGITQKQLAAQLGVSEVLIGGVIKHKRWKHIP